MKLTTCFAFVIEHVCVMVPKDVDPEVFILWTLHKYMMYSFSCKGAMVAVRVFSSPYTVEVSIECYFTCTGLYQHRVLLEHILVWDRFKLVGEPAMWSCFPCLFPMP